MSLEDLNDLQTIFPQIESNILRAALLVCGDAPSAINYLLENINNQDEIMSLAQAMESAGEVENDEEIEGEENDEGDEDEDEDIEPVVPVSGVHTLTQAELAGEEAVGDTEVDSQSELDDDDEDYMYRPIKKRVTLDPSTNEGGSGDGSGPPRYLCKFDEVATYMSHIQLLNLLPSKLDHSVFSLFNEIATTTEQADHIETSCAQGGVWSYFFPLSDIDHVWRCMVNACIHVKRFGDMFKIRAGGVKGERDAVLLAYVADTHNIQEIKRVGTGMMSAVHAKEPLLFTTIKSTMPAEAAPLPNASRKRALSMDPVLKADLTREEVLMKSTHKIERTMQDGQTTFELFTVLPSSATSWIRIPH